MPSAVSTEPTRTTRIDQKLSQPKVKMMDNRFGNQLQVVAAIISGFAVVSFTACSSITTKTASDLVEELNVKDVYISSSSPDDSNVGGVAAMASNEDLGLQPQAPRSQPAAYGRTQLATAERQAAVQPASQRQPGQLETENFVDQAPASSVEFVSEELTQPSPLEFRNEEPLVTEASESLEVPTEESIVDSNKLAEDRQLGEVSTQGAPSTYSEEADLPQVVTRAAIESQTAGLASAHVDYVNVNDGFNFAPIKNASEVTLQAAPVVTSNTPELSTVAQDILAHADSPEISLALAEAMTGTRASDLMPQVWVQDEDVQIDPIALEPFSVGAIPMYQRGVAFEPVETTDFTKSKSQVRSSEESESWLTRTPSKKRATQKRSGRTKQVSYESLEESAFVNVQSESGDCVDVVGVTLGEISSTSSDCNICPTDQVCDSNCPNVETVVMPSSSIRPPDEYVCDGGDAGVHVRVNEDWTVRGLDLEDTVGHFDTLDGRTIVSPSNSVCVYAPRFANVRKVIGPYSDDQIIEPGRLLRPEIVGQDRQSEAFLSVDKRQMAERDVQIDNALVFRDRTRGISMNIRQRVGALTNVQDVYQDFHVLQYGIFKRSEKARLAEFVDAAEVWTEAVGPEVLIDNVAAKIDVISQRPAIAYHVDDSGNPQLRVVKIASTKEALPGDEVEFTLRFDNVGDQTIGNVTIIDNLTARLEYVPETAKCDVKADFFTEENEGGSLTLRWEIVEPLKAGEGGVATFTCKMR